MYPKHLRILHDAYQALNTYIVFSKLVKSRIKVSLLIHQVLMNTYCVSYIVRNCDGAVMNETVPTSLFPSGERWIGP